MNTIDTNYQAFLKIYTQDLIDLIKRSASESPTTIMNNHMKPMSRREWIAKELDRAVENGNYDYAEQLREEYSGSNMPIH